MMKIGLVRVCDDGNEIVRPPYVGQRQRETSYDL